MATGGDEPGYFLCVSYLEDSKDLEDVSKNVLDSLEIRRKSEFETVDDFDNFLPVCRREIRPKPLQGPGNVTSSTPKFPVANRQTVEVRLEKNFRKRAGPRLERFEDGKLAKLAKGDYIFNTEDCGSTVWSAGCTKDNFWFR